MKKLIAICILAAVLAACESNNFPKYNVLGDLRILTIVADRPEANPGDTVTFTPVLSDLKGNGRTISYSVQACIDPGVGIGAAPACPAPDPASIQTGTVTIPAGTSMTYTGPVAPFSLTLPDEATILASRSAADQYNGVAYLVFYTVSVPDGTRIDSFLRVIVSSPDKTQKNQNPVIASIDMNGSPATDVIPLPQSPVDFRMTAAAGSAETYQVMQPDGSLVQKTEELESTWFVSDGEFDYIRTIGSDENPWSPPAAKPQNRGSVILVVTRDGRGGMTVRKIEME